MDPNVISYSFAQLKVFVQQPTPSPPPDLPTLAQDLEDLEKTWGRIRAVVKDAQDMEIWKESVKDWLRELRSLAYDIEDVLGICNYELLKAKAERRAQQVEGEVNAGNSMEVVLSPLVNTSLLSHVARKVEKIKDKFDAIADRKEKLGLKLEDGERRFKYSPRRPSTGPSLPWERMVGRDKETEDLIKLLKSEDKKNPEEEQFSSDRRDSGYDPEVVAVVGMPGVGKTTLAQRIYNDQKIVEHFESNKWWVHVPQEFELVAVTKALVEALTGDNSQLTQLSVLQQKVIEELEGKKFLLVLDDVWNEVVELWERFKSALVCGAPGSRILVTTRNKPVAEAMHAPVYPLDCLGKDECWSLFRRCAFAGGPQNSDAEYPRLVEIGKDIVKKCNFLPLAVKVLGNLLTHDRKEENWRHVLQSDIWKNEKQEEQIMGALQLSYDYLPSDIKPCFSFCSLLPKGCKIRKEYLVQLWLAHGALGEDEQYRKMEDKGALFIDDLLSRSFFHHVDEARVGMHDLIHDLARKISGDECQSQVIKENHPLYLSNVTQHASFLATHVSKAIDLPSSEESPNLRTLLFPANDWLANVKIHRSTHLECLRALDLSSNTKTESFLDSIGYLKLLRYLNLSGTEIKSLPESICRLYNLQTLDLSCTQIKRLPDTICNLGYLRHLYLQSNKMFKMLPESIARLCNLQTLDVSSTGIIRRLRESICELKCLRHLYLWNNRGMTMLPESIGDLCSLETLNFCGTEIEELPKGIGRLTSLKVLTDFHVGISKKHAGIEELKDLNVLVDSLCISKLCNVVTKDAAKLANLKGKNYLRKLTLDWDAYWGKEVSNLDEEVLESLEPHMNLEELKIVWYGAAKFPNWMEWSYFRKLVRVELSHCQRCKALPSLTQLPSLRILIVVKMTALKEVIHGFSGSNRNADESSSSQQYTLQISDCPKLTLLQVFALQKLDIEECEKLKTLELDSCSQSTMSLRRLTVDECPLLKQWCKEQRNGKLTSVPTVKLDGNECHRASSLTHTTAASSVDRQCDLVPEANSMTANDVAQPVAGLPVVAGSSTDVRGAFPLRDKGKAILTEEDTNLN